MDLGNVYNDSYDFSCGSEFNLFKLALKSDFFRAIKVKAKLARKIDLSGGTKNVDEIVIHRCLKLKTIVWPEYTGSIKILKISHAHDLMHLDLSKLTNLEELSIFNCEQLTQITHLPPQLRILNIQACPILTLDISSLKNLNLINLITTANQFNIDIHNHPNLTMVSIESMKAISGQITNCNALTTLNIESGDSPATINLTSCPNLSTAFFSCGPHSAIFGLADCRYLDYFSLENANHFQLDIDPETLIKKNKINTGALAVNQKINELKNILSQLKKQTSKLTYAIDDTETSINQSIPIRTGKPTRIFDVDLVSIPKNRNIQTSENDRSKLLLMRETETISLYNKIKNNFTAFFNLKSHEENPRKTEPNPQPLHSTALPKNKMNRAPVIARSAFATKHRHCEERFLRRSNPGFDFLPLESRSLGCFVAKSAPRNDGASSQKALLAKTGIDRINFAIKLRKDREIALRNALRRANELNARQKASFVTPLLIGYSRIICHSRVGGNPSQIIDPKFFFKIKENEKWVPVFAGMTRLSRIVPDLNGYPSGFCHSRAGGNPSQMIEPSFFFTIKENKKWVPVYAGMTGFNKIVPDLNGNKNPPLSAPPDLVGIPDDQSGSKPLNLSIPNLQGNKNPPLSIPPSLTDIPTEASAIKPLNLFVPNLQKNESTPLSANPMLTDIPFNESGMVPLSTVIPRLDRGTQRLPVNGTALPANPELTNIPSDPSSQKPLNLSNPNPQKNKSTPLSANAMLTDVPLDDSGITHVSVIPRLDRGTQRLPVNGTALPANPELTNITSDPSSQKRLNLSNPNLQKNKSTPLSAKAMLTDVPLDDSGITHVSVTPRLDRGTQRLPVNGTALPANPELTSIPSDPSSQKPLNLSNPNPQKNKSTPLSANAMLTDVPPDDSGITHVSVIPRLDRGTQRLPMNGSALPANPELTSIPSDPSSQKPLNLYVPNPQKNKSTPLSANAMLTDVPLDESALNSLKINLKIKNNQKQKITGHLLIANPELIPIKPADTTSLLELKFKTSSKQFIKGDLLKADAMLTPILPEVPTALLDLKFSSFKQKVDAKLLIADPMLVETTPMESAALKHVRFNTGKGM